MPVKRTTYKDDVVSYVYQELQNGKLNPGDKLLESYLAKVLGISRAPIREAMRELVTDGILDYKPQVGNFVATLSVDEILDAYTTRGVLEGYAVSEGLENISDEFLADLELLCGLMERYARTGKQKELVDCGRKFHALLFGQCKNALVVEYTERLSFKLHLLFYKHSADLYQAEEISRRHLDLIDLIRCRDKQIVEQALRQHYLETGQKVASLYLNNLNEDN